MQLQEMIVERHMPFTIFSTNGNILQNCSMVSQPGCWHWHSWATEHLCHHGDPSCCPSRSEPSSLLLPSPLCYQSVLHYCNFQECYISGIVQYITYWDWLFHSSLCVSVLHFSLWLNSFCYMGIPYFIHPSKDIWIVSGFYLLRRKLLCISMWVFCERKSSLLWNKCPWV